jgi:hypothetical protein
MNARHLVALVAATISLASCADADTEQGNVNAVDQSTQTVATDVPPITADLMSPAAEGQFFDRLDAIAQGLGLNLGQPVSDWRRSGITAEQLADICTNAFAGVPPAIDELTAQREFAITVAACPDATVETFLDVHPPDSGSADTDYSIFSDLVGDMIVAATADPPLTADVSDVADERPLYFLPIEIAADPEFISGQFPEPPQPDGSVLAKLGRVDDSIAVSFSPFDPGADTNCVAVSIVPLGAFTRLDATTGEPCDGVDLDEGHRQRDFYRSQIAGKLSTCNGVRTVVIDVRPDTLALTPGDAAEALDLPAPASTTGDLTVGVQLTTGLLEATHRTGTSTSYFVPLVAEFPGPITPPTLEELEADC